MKPTVIANSGTNENPQNHPSGSNINPAGNNIGPNTESGGTSNANAHPNLRQFPQFQTGFRFDDDDDIFLDAGLRSRLNRFRDPFSFARKRCGNNESNDDPYSRYFDDDTDFFQNFGSFPSRRRAAAPSGNNSNSNQFFEHIPQEFRHYIPEGFGFQHDRTAPKHPQTKHDQQHPQQQQQQQHPYPQQQHPHPQQQQQHPHPQQQQQQHPHPQQYYEAHAQPSSPTYTQPPQQKPKLCDAAIQTEDLGIPQNEIKEGKNLKQYGMRNTVDLGQKSPPEECRGSRSHSAPPVDGPEQGAFTSANAYEQASAGPPTRQVDESQQTSQGTQPMTPPHPPPRQHVPNSHQQYQPWNQQQQQQPPQQQEANSPSGGVFVRTVPIIIEGRSEPTVNKTRAPPQQQHQQQQPQQQQQQQPKQKPAHPTPLNTHQTPTPSNEAPPPQTPHTAECINRIQGIQRDVLALMAKVEHFKGMRNDKEYMFLDEMLTRNLLKLDTIDTNGKDSIRLARREAIKCIQASINVLEAKSEENAKAAQQQTVMDSIEQKADENATENTCNENAESENLNRPLENIAIPLPPPPEKKQDQTVEESKKQESTEKTTEEAAPVISQETKLQNAEKLEDDSKTGKKEAYSTDPNLNPSSETVIESTAKESDDKESSNKSETLDAINPKISENVNVGEGIKTTGGAVKKKIIKKKKPATKSESVSPAEKSSEDLPQEATEKEP